MTSAARKRAARLRRRNPRTATDRPERQRRRSRYLTHYAWLTRAARSFWAGATTANAPTALAAIAFAAVELVLAACLVTPARLARISPRYLRQSSQDDRADVTVHALRLRTRSRREPTVVYIGASNARLGLPQNGSHVQTALRSALDAPVRFVPLFANGQTVGEWLVLLDQVPSAFRGVVLLSVYDQLSTLRGRNARRGDVRERLALPSPTLDAHAEMQDALDDEHARWPGPTGNYFIDHLGFFAARRSTLVRLESARLRPLPEVQPQRPDEAWRAYARTVRRQEGPPFLDMLDELRTAIAPLVDRGVEVVLVEAPVNPRYDAAKPRRQSRVRVYEPAMFAFAKEVGARYWNPSVEAELTADDFRDRVHVRSDRARRRFEAAIVRRVAALMSGEAVPDGPPTPTDALDDGRWAGRAP